MDQDTNKNNQPRTKPTRRRRRRRRRSSLRGLFVFFLVMALGVSAGLLTNEGKRQFDVVKDISRQVEWKVRQRLNLPLPGTPDLTALNKRLEEKKMTLGSAIYIRVFKLESKLEIWMKNGAQYELFTTYPICRWSGRLGPKLKEGDKQSPEGFYTVSKGQLNPNSRWYRSFNLGYPNRFDRSHSRTGSFLMVHGGCSSVGCFAMTNPQMKEIWHIVTAALNNRQKRFAVHVFPFKMTKRNRQVYKNHRWAAFWDELTPAYNYFNETKQVPQVAVCNKQYKVRRGDEKSGLKSQLAACPPSLS